jgi:hypothetical protein
MHPRPPVRYERVLNLLSALDPAEWVDLGDDGEVFAYRGDVRLQIQIEEMLDGEEVGECQGVLPDKYETFVLRFDAVELMEYWFAILDRREAAMKVLPFSPDGDQDRVSLVHYNIGCLVYGKDVMDDGLKEFKIRVAVEGGLRGLK